MFDIIIVGAGTAGLSAAVYAQRAGKQTLVLESDTYGGQIVNTPEIENYPGIAHISGFDFIQGLSQQAADLGATMKFEKVLSIENRGVIKIVHTRKNEYVCKAVILATGAKNRHLGLEKEEELVGRGISYCATCDGAFFKGKDVAVNGGGNTALGDALYLANNGINKVYIIHRRDEFRGAESDVETIKKTPNIELVLNSTVQELRGGDHLEAVVVENKNTKQRREIPVSALFVAIGQVPDNEAFAPLVDLDPKGYIKADESCSTRTAGIFTAGDCRTKMVRQLSTAAADGAIAATQATQYLNSL